MIDELKPGEMLLLKALLSGHRIVKAFEEQTGEKPSDEVLRIAISQYIEYNRSKDR